MSEQKSRAEYNAGPVPTDGETTFDLRAREEQLEREQAKAEIKARLRKAIDARLIEGMLARSMGKGEGDGPFVFTVRLPLGGSNQGQKQATPDQRDTMIEYLREENRRLAAQAGDDWRKHAASLHLAHAKGLAEAEGDVSKILGRIIMAVGILTEGD